MILKPSLTEREANDWRPTLPQLDNWPVLAWYAEVVRVLPPNPVCVEIGVSWGRSLLFLAASCLQRNWSGAHLYGIDPQGRPRPPDGSGGSIPSMGQGLRALLRHASDEEMQLIHLVQLESRYAARAFGPATVDLLFVDGDHRREAAASDLEAWEAVVKPGGVISGDDYWPMYPGVREAVDARYASRGVYTWERIWWVDPLPPF